MVLGGRRRNLKQITVPPLLLLKYVDSRSTHLTKPLEGLNELALVERGEELRTMPV